MEGAWKEFRITLWLYSDCNSQKSCFFFIFTLRRLVFFITNIANLCYPSSRYRGYCYWWNHVWPTLGDLHLTHWHPDILPWHNQGRRYNAICKPKLFSIPGSFSYSSPIVNRMFYANFCCSRTQKHKEEDVSLKLCHISTVKGSGKALTQGRIPNYSQIVLPCANLPYNVPIRTRP